MLNIENLSFSFDRRQILKDLSLNLAQGEIGTLIGCSGSGKTTLLKLLTGILPAPKETFSIASCPPPMAYSHVAYMMQDDLLLPWRNILNNLLLVGELGKKPRMSDSLRQEAYYFLREVGLEGWETAYPDQLSGGMRQRVSLARILLQKRPMLLLDEPFAALDVSLREQMHSLLHDIRRRHGTTMLMVTHDFRDALSLSDRIFLLSHGQIVRDWKISSNVRMDPKLFQMFHEEMYEAIREGAKR